MGELIALRLSEGALLALLVPCPRRLWDVGASHARETSQPTRPVAGRQRVEVFLHVRLPWQHLDTGKRKQGRKHPGRGLGPSQELDTGDISPRARVHSPGEPSRPSAPQTDRALRADHWHAPCWGAEGEPTREPLGEAFPSPCPPLLSPHLPLAEAGLPAEVWAVPRAQMCAGLSMTVGTEQSWQAQGLWLRSYTRAWVCPLSSPLP